MTSVAEKTRRRRSRTAATALQVAIERTDPKAAAAAALEERSTRRAAAMKYQRRMTGLLWLQRLGALELAEVAAGERYGRDYRFSVMESGAALKSSLDFEEGGGGGRGGMPSLFDYSGMIVEAREAILLARAHINFHAGQVMALDLICGQQQTPREVWPEQRMADEAVAVLRVALQQLVEHYAEGAGRN